MGDDQIDTIAAVEPPAPRRAVLAALALAMLLASLGTSIANVALPTLAEAFAVPMQQVQWVILAYLLAITTLIVSAGRLGDRVGRRRLLLAGIALFTLASLAAGIAPSLGGLIAARAAQGLGAAVMMVLTLATIGAAAPKARTGRAMGLLGTSSAIGTALGPSLGGALVAATGWRAIFLVMVPLGAITLLLAVRALPRDRPAQAADRTGFDALGSALLALTLAAYALAMTLGRDRFGVLNLALLVAALAGAGLFLVVERRAPAPLVRLALLRDPALAAGLATSVLIATVMMTTLVVGPFYLARGLDLDTARIGLAMSPGPPVAAGAGLPAGRLVDHVGAPRATGIGLTMMAAAAALLALLPAAAGLAGYVAPLVVLTAGYALFQAANTTAVMRATAADQRGVVSGLLNLARNLGLISGASVMAAVFAIASGLTPIPSAREAASVGMRATFAVVALLLVIAGLIALHGHRHAAIACSRARRNDARSSTNHRHGSDAREYRDD